MEDTNLLPTKRTVLYAMDAHTANAKERTGVENYAFHLIQAMKSHPLEEGERVVLYSHKPLNKELSALPRGWSSKVLRWPPRYGWMSMRVAWELHKDKPNLFFVPSQAIPRTNIPVVTTLHDVGFRVVPEVYEPKTRKRLEAKTRLAIARAEHLLCVSEATKQDLTEHYHVPEERLSVTPLALDTSVYRRLELESIKDAQQRYRVGQRFFMSVGRLEQKKNISTLIRAFDLFKSRRGSGDPYELLLIGNPGYGYAHIKTFIDASPYREQIRELGYVRDEETAALMNAATAYVFPSWFEGFGIPNLEAMACGAPLLTSDIPAHHEVVGDAGVFVDPHDPDAWARAMTTVIDDPRERERLIEKGYEQVKKFSWNQTAQKTWEVLRSLI